MDADDPLRWVWPLCSLATVLAATHLLATRCRWWRLAAPWRWVLSMALALPLAAGFMLAGAYLAGVAFVLVAPPSFGPRALFALGMLCVCASALVGTLAAALGLAKALNWLQRGAVHPARSASARGC